MLSLEELKKETDLLNEIDWDLGPEEAVKLYLEWGNLKKMCVNSKAFMRLKMMSKRG